MRTVPCSEPYGEDGDYEEYYDEDMNYSAGDPASAGKGRSVWRVCTQCTPSPDHRRCIGTSLSKHFK